MPTEIKLTKGVDRTTVAPGIRWPPGSRLSEQDKAAFAAYTREVEQVIKQLAEAVRELQSNLNGKGIG